MTPLVAIDTAQGMGLTLTLVGTDVRCVGPVNAETTAMVALLRTLRSDVGLLLGDQELLALLRAGVDEDTAFAGCERAAIIKWDGVRS